MDTNSQAHTQPWQQELLRNGTPAAVVETLTEIRTGISGAASAVESMKVTTAEMNTLLGKILEAFPEDGLKEHAEYHRSLRERTQFWKEVRVDLAKKGIVFAMSSLALFAVTALWVAFKAKLVE